MDTITPPRILVFDSGLGGLSVAREVHHLLPQVQLIYFGDTAFFPYGSKPEEVLIERVLAQISRLELTTSPDLIVLACNTASTLVLPQLRAQTATPVVGVVPAIKPAAAHSQSGVIGLLATPGTVQRDYTASLIAEHAGHCRVVAVGSTELVLLAEGKLRGRPPSRRALSAILQPFLEHPKHSELDTMVLACTHFPLLTDELAEAYGRPVRWVDSGAAIAQRVASLLPNNVALAAASAMDSSATHPAQRRITGNQALFSHPPQEVKALRTWLSALDMELAKLPDSMVP